MSSALDRAVKHFKQAIQEAGSNKTRPFDTQAEVVRVEDGVAWVHMPGGVDETPVQLTVNAKKGDTVQVRVAGGQAWLVGNGSSPPTDDTRAIQADDKASSAVENANIAKMAAGQAEEAAAQAVEAAGAATNILHDMEEAAEQAETSLTQIFSDTKSASQSAEQAQESADSAKASADQAFRQVGFVEDIVGVLQLVAEHGNYQPADENEVQPNKWYFTKQPNGSYQVVNNPTSVFHLTEDTAIDVGKIYYTRTGTGTEEDPYIYTVVDDPDVSEIGTYYEKYYVLTGIDESIRNYVSSHLVLTQNGLSLQADNNPYRLDITPMGIQILNGDGLAVAEYGETGVIGLKSGFHVVIGENEVGVSEIGFYSGQTKLAYMNGSELYVTNSLAFGHFTFIERANGHFTLKLIRS